MEYELDIGGPTLTRLVPSHFDAAITSAGIDEDDVWPDRARQGIHFDLRYVEWVELESVVTLLMFAEKVKLAGYRCGISLPDPAAPIGESASAAEAAANRAAVLQYLEYLRFRQAADIAHVTGPPVHIIAPSADDGRTSDGSRAATDDEPLYRYVFPLVWLSSRDITHVHSLAQFLRLVIGEPTRGLQPLDSAAISNVLLYELIDNAERHAQSSGHALVAARVRKPRDLPRLSDVFSTDRDYLGWLRHAVRPLVELVVADAGAGIHRTLRAAFRHAVTSRHIRPLVEWPEDPNVLAWSLDRWSTQDESDSKRGTRGLYRIDRVATKYEGLISLRAGRTVVATDHGGAAHDTLRYHVDLAPQPGSLVRLWIPAFREAAEPPRPTTRGPEPTFRFVRLGGLTPDGISREARERLGRALRGQQSRNTCTIAVVDGGTETRDAIESALRQAVEIRHPAALMLFGLPGGWDLVSAAIESVNEDHLKAQRSIEHASSEHFEIWDPVLVVGTSFDERGWVGTTDEVRVVLDLLLEKGRLAGPQLAQLLPDDAARGEARRTLRNDTSLAQLHADGDISTRVDFKRLAAHVRSKVRKHIETHREGVRLGPFLTPSLTTVNLWIDVAVVLARTCTPVVALSILADELRRQMWFRVPAAILSDITALSAHAELLRRFLGSERTEVIAPDATFRDADVVRTLEPGIAVAIYADVVSSGETVGRCVAQALRDGAQVVAIVCVVDGRPSPGSTLDFHGMAIPVVSLVAATRDSPAPRKRSSDLTYIRPATLDTEHESLVEPACDYPLDAKTLAHILRRTNALHFRHVANRALNRHFTLYLDSGSILGDATVLDSAVACIQRWHATKNGRTRGRTFELWHAGASGAGAVGRLAARVAERLSPVAVRRVQRKSNYGRWTFSLGGVGRLGSETVAILDWGAITGGSIAGLVNLALEHKAKDVLVVIVASQLPKAEETLLRRIARLKGQTASQRSLFNDTAEKLRSPQQPRGGASAVRVSVEMLSRFELEAYMPAACPACRQLDRMALERYPTQLLESYAHSYKTRRLRRWHREDVATGLAEQLSAPALDAEAVLYMAHFRGLLQDALGSTRTRELVLRRLSEWADRASASTSVPVDMVAALHFLTIESHWLARPPLHLPRVRAVLGQLCRTVAARSDVDIDTAVSALIVHRIGARTEFAEQFLHLFHTVRQRPDALAQLLYSAHTFLTRPYVQSPDTVRPLLNALMELETTLTTDPATTFDDISPTIASLAARAEFEYARGQHERDSPLIAWRQLRTAVDLEHSKPHPPTVVAISEMLPGSDAVLIDAAVQRTEAGVDAALDPDIVEWIRSLDHAWTTCRRFLDRTVLPLLAKMPAILASYDFGTFFGPSAAASLRTLVDSRASVAESEFGVLVSALAESPLRLLEQRHWTTYKSEVLWYYDHIFRTADESGSPASLVEFLRSIPASVDDIVRETLVPVGGDHCAVDVEWPSGGDGRARKAFCPEPLFQQTVKHLVRNAGKHAVEGRRPGIRFTIQETAERIVLRGGTWHTVATEDFGAQERVGGLRDLERRLRAFGGCIHLDNRPRSPRLTFLTTVEVLKV